MTLRFAGKGVVVTGASRGIGAAIARRFARDGASVMLCANERAVEDVAAELAAAGAKAAAFVADVTKSASSAPSTSRSRTPASSPSPGSRR
jgi:meso-butanediol dehydrogenase/(S,S)-butanediol dehydrogenase/diacetyl reductase